MNPVRHSRAFPVGIALLALVPGVVLAQGGPGNLALVGEARQSSDFGAGQFPASIANNGNFGDFTATATDDDNAMWEVDLGIDAEIERIVVHNRDNCCGSRLRDIVVSIHDISFLDDEPIDDLILGIPTAELEEIWDSALFESEVLNLENELGGGGLDGPEFLEIDLAAVAGGAVTGRFVRVLRVADPDLSGTGGQGNLDEPNVMSLGEVEVFAAVDCPEVGDTHCEELVVTPLDEDGPGRYEVTVLADDDSGDDVLYTIVAERTDGPGAGEQIVVGPGPSNVATLSLAAGVWTIRASVDDSLVCEDAAADMDCDGVVVEFENLAIEGVATQSSDYNASLNAAVGNDGNLRNFTATAALDENPIWEVDLLDERSIASILVYNRGDGCCQARLRDIIVSIHDVSFLEDANIDERVRGVPVAELKPVWDSASFESAVLNQENELDGPARLFVDVEALAGGPVSGRYVRVLRISDPDLSGTGGVGGGDDVSILSVGEVEVFGGTVNPDVPRFVRGDANSNGTIDLTDGIVTLNFLFAGGVAPACMDAADVDDSGTLAITDAISVLTWLFSGGRVPVAPSPSSAVYVTADCGADPGASDALGCERLAGTCAG